MSAQPISYFLQVICMLRIWLCLIYKNIVLHNEETNRPSTKKFVEMVLHGVDRDGHHVIGVLSELTRHLTPLVHLSGLVIN